MRSCLCCAGKGSGQELRSFVTARSNPRGYPGGHTIAVEDNETVSLSTVFRVTTDGQPDEVSRLLRAVEVEALYGIPEGTLRRWRYEGRPPTYLKLGRSIYYDPADLKLFFDANRHTPRRPAL